MTMRSAFFALACVACAAATGCIQRAPPAETGPTVLVGAAVASTGWMAAYDRDPLEAARLAIDEINRRGGLLGRQVRLRAIDTKSEQTDGSVAALELLDRGAKLILTSCDFDMGAPAAIEAETRRTIAFAMCAGDPLMGADGVGPFTYNMSTISPVAGYVAAEWAIRRKRWHKAYILLEDSSAYQRSLCNAFEKRWRQLAGEGAVVVGKDVYTARDATIASQITRIAARPDRPDFIYFCASGPPGISGIRQLRASGITTPILSDGAFDGDWWRASVPSLRDFYYTTWFSMYGDDEDPRINRFFADYRKRHGELPTIPVNVFTYSAIQAWADAVRRAGTFEGDAVRRQLNRMKALPTLSGPATFTDRIHYGLIGRGMTMMEVQDWKHISHGRFYPSVRVDPGL